MELIDRNIIILKPRAPFLKWQQSLPDAIEGLTLEDLEGDPTAILVPELDSFDELNAFIKAHCRELFEFVLSDWHPNRQEWPPKRDHKTFSEWFSIQWSSCVAEMEQEVDDLDD
jgi:hypothetical protein